MKLSKDINCECKYLQMLKWSVKWRLSLFPEYDTWMVKGSSGSRWRRNYFSNMQTCNMKGWIKINHNTYFLQSGSCNYLALLLFSWTGYRCVTTIADNGDICQHVFERLEPSPPLHFLITIIHLLIWYFDITTFKS